jgi:hypothetical protein
MLTSRQQREHANVAQASIGQRCFEHRRLGSSRSSLSRATPPVNAEDTMHNQSPTTHLDSRLSTLNSLAAGAQHSLTSPRIFSRPSPTHKPLALPPPATLQSTSPNPSPALHQPAAQPHPRVSIAKKTRMLGCLLSLPFSQWFSPKSKHPTIRMLTPSRMLTHHQSATSWLGRETRRVQCR